MAAAVARQWFGVLMRPRTPADAWLVDGLAGWLEGWAVKTFQGQTELTYRWVQRAIANRYGFRWSMSFSHMQSFKQTQVNSELM